MSSNQAEACIEAARLGPVHFPALAMAETASKANLADDVEDLYVDLLGKLSHAGLCIETDPEGIYWILRFGSRFVAIRRSLPPSEREAFFYTAESLSDARLAGVPSEFNTSTVRRLMWICAVKNPAGLGWQTYSGQEGTLNSRSVVNQFLERLSDLDD